AIISTRAYRCDALYTVTLWAKPAKPPYTMKDLQKALNEPKFVLYLGRKSCPPALPLKAQIIEALSIKKAFSRSEFPPVDGLVPSNQVEVFWEEPVESGFEAQQVFRRRDALLSRKRWQFLERDERHAVIDRAAAGVA
ncbi:MAG: type I-E CRISPR-associated protein Cas5/CasD, partial [Elusimicrobia bacterium]|nr:type I-E CRISPR-associated protein Cas5/CasD [Elusimicrobiota bacterium]